MTIGHLTTILTLIDKKEIKNVDNQYSTWDRDKLINEDILAKWLNKNIQTLRNWRCDGKGPKFIKDSRTVNYRVGTVIDWIKSREVQSTTQADLLK